MGTAFLMGQGGGGVKNPVKAISYSGTAADAAYFTEAGTHIGFNENGDVFVTLQSGTSTSYENIKFSLTAAPAGIDILTPQTYTHASNPASTYYTFVLTGVSNSINIDIDFNTLNSTYDYVTASITVTIA